MKAKVGIITLHRANNYGAALQCYALQETLASLGYDAVVIDYRQPYVELAYNPIRWDIVKQGLTRPRLLGGYLTKVLPERWRRAKKYNCFRNQYFRCSAIAKNADEIPQDMDLYVIGSDQMWSLHCTGGKLDELFFGVFPHPKSSKICGYAISSNLRSLDEIGRDALSKYVQNFSSLSFREKTICGKVEEMTGVCGRVDLDPTLLLDPKVWEKMADKPLTSKKYVLTYFLHDGAAFDENLQNQVKTFAHKMGCEFINIFDIAVSPSEFLSAIKYATFIIATSFHATAFSILFNKQFYSLKTDDGKDVRYINLLNELGISNRLTDVSNLLLHEDDEIDYGKVQKRLNILREESIVYLENLKL